MPLSVDRRAGGEGSGQIRTEGVPDLALVVLATPGSDALHDEELFAGPDPTNLTCLTRKRVEARRAGNPGVDTCLLGSKLGDFSATRLEGILRLEIGRERAVREEADERDHKDRKQES